MTQERKDELLKESLRLIGIHLDEDENNYPKTIQLGDAFQVRDTDWALPRCA